jgi:hypothetical protein
MDLDPAGRMLLGMLDGTRSVDEMASLMRVPLAQSGVELPQQTLAELTHRHVWLFARQGLLAEPVGP